MKKVQLIQEEREKLLQEIKKVQTCADVCHLFCLNKGILFHTLVLGVIHATCDFTLHGITYSIQTVGYSYNVNIFILGCAMILSSLLMSTLFDNIVKILAIEENRKRGFIIISTIGSLLALSMLLTFVEKTKIAMTVIVFLVNFCLSTYLMIQPVFLVLK